MHAFLPSVTEEEEVFNHCKNEEEEERRSSIIIISNYRGTHIPCRVTPARRRRREV
jgi:hypothetical protein